MSRVILYHRGRVFETRGHGKETRISRRRGVAYGCSVRYDIGKEVVVELASCLEFSFTDWLILLGPRTRTRTRLGCFSGCAILLRRLP